MAVKGSCGKPVKKADCGVLKSACFGCQFMPSRKLRKMQNKSASSDRQPTITVNMIANANSRKFTKSGSNVSQAI
ncbi:MAG TPA: hypothetical protein P5323_04555 [Candidatus Moranbacteria bacterium]|nr:hypothetical protein [Candidatus Moranbacteria bacterium]